MTVVHDVMWTEKYRPQSLDEMALEEQNRALLKSYLDAGEIPHLLMHGPPGTGKTTVAKIISNTVDAALLTLNASNERGIDTIRDKVGNFVRVKSGKKFNHVFLDEADQLTPDAQATLRNMMETYAERSRFILTANRPHKIMDALQSRCQVLKLSETPLKERAKVLARVLKAEGYDIDPKAVIGYAERYTDMRRLLSSAQKAVLASGGTLTALEAASGEGEAIWQALTLGKKVGYSQLTALSKTPGFDHHRALTDLFWKIPGDHPQAAEMRFAVAKAIHESSWTPDIVVHFLGTCSELMTLVK